MAFIPPHISLENILLWVIRCYRIPAASSTASTRAPIEISMQDLPPERALHSAA
jgi:hypothetical protein